MPHLFLSHQPDSRAITDFVIQRIQETKGSRIVKSIGEVATIGHCGCPIESLDFHNNHFTIAIA